MHAPSPFRFAALAGGLAACLVAGPARGSDEGLRTDARVDLPVAAGAAALWLGLELLKGALAPASCRWCDRRADGSDALDAPDAATRAAFRWSDTGAAGLASDITGNLVAPIASLGMLTGAAAADDRASDAPANALIVVESVAIAASLNDVVKLLVARQRPFVHFRDPAAAARHDPDDNLSFYSGHTSLAFSLAVSSGTIASMRGYPLAPVVWAASLPVALVTGYLRIAADKHYLTDVVAGAVLGSAVGFLVPFVFHRAPTTPSDPPAPGAVPVAAMRGPLFAVSAAF